MNNDDHERRVAVLIDAENIAPKYLPIVLSEANNLGSVNIKRIYGDWTMPQMSSWRTVILDNSIQPIQQYSNVSGKNSSDSALIIDAMDLLYRLLGFRLYPPCRPPPRVRNLCARHGRTKNPEELHLRLQ